MDVNVCVSICVVCVAYVCEHVYACVCEYMDMGVCARKRTCVYM